MDSAAARTRITLLRCAMSSGGGHSTHRLEHAHPRQIPAPSPATRCGRGHDRFGCERITYGKASGVPDHRQRGDRVIRATARGGSSVCQRGGRRARPRAARAAWRCPAARRARPRSCSAARRSACTRPESPWWASLTGRGRATTCASRASRRRSAEPSHCRWSTPARSRSMTPSDSVCRASQRPGMRSRSASFSGTRAACRTSAQSDAFREALFRSLTMAPPPATLLTYVADEPLNFTPGTQYRYSNSDNVAVGLMVESATGTSYEEALRVQVTKPLRLPRRRCRPGSRCRRRSSTDTTWRTTGPPRTYRGLRSGLGVGFLRNRLDAGEPAPLHPRLRRRQALRRWCGSSSVAGCRWAGRSRPGPGPCSLPGAGPLPDLFRPVRVRPG